MKCHEAKHRLDLFMDGELSVPENLEVLEHLNLCVACVSVYEGEKALRASLKARLGTERAPASLYEKLSRVGVAPSSKPEDKPLGVSFRSGKEDRRRWGALAAAVFFATLAATLLFTPSVETPRALAAEAVARHVETHDGFCGEKRDDCMCPCGKCCSDLRDAEGKFFRRHVSHTVCAHDLTPLGYSFAGAAVWDHRGAKVCWTVQRDPAGRSITHALVATPLAMDRSAGPLALLSKDHPVLFVPSAPGMTCVFIFDAQAEADRFAAFMSGK